MATILQKANRMAIIDLYPLSRHLSICVRTSLPCPWMAYPISMAAQETTSHVGILSNDLKASHAFMHLNKSNCPIETWELEPQWMICSWCLLPSIAPPETHTSKALTKIARSKFWLSCTMQPVEDENHVSGTNEVDDHPQVKLWPSMICCDQTSLIPS
jgi:hypothetical protein